MPGGRIPCPVAHITHERKLTIYRVPVELALPGSDTLLSHKLCIDKELRLEVWVALASTLQHDRAQAQHSGSLHPSCGALNTKAWCSSSGTACEVGML